MTLMIKPELNLTNQIADRYYISTMYDCDGKCYKTAVTDIRNSNILFEQTTTSYRMAKGNHQRAIVRFVNEYNKEGAEVVYEYVYVGSYSVRTSIPLKGQGISKSERVEGLYFVTSKALERLKKRHKCVCNMDYAI
ncbi:hypothetical protein [Capnocytophaga granulosa]|nr:MAG TPA: hypothetical protein [Caudoviricetes sp.]